MSDIVIADDVDTVRANLCALFESLGHRTIAAADGKEALKAVLSAKAEGRTPDLLVSDIQMPEMDGEMLLEILKTKGIVVPCVVVSGCVDKQQIIRLMRLGCRDVLEKPFSMEELQNRAEAVLREVDHKMRIARKEMKRRDELGRRMRQHIHDVNNLLGISVGFADLAMDNAEDDAAIQRCLSRVINASREASRIVSNALHLKISELDRRRNATNVSVLVENLSILLGGLLPENISLSVDIQSNSFWIDAEADRIHQAILNLGLNAVDAMPEGGSLRIWVKCLPELDRMAGAVAVFDGRNGHPEEYISIGVEDSGMGFAPDIAHRVFEKGYTTKSFGTGIGLWCVKEIVGEHGGAVYVNVDRGTGTCITLSFPRTKPTSSYCGYLDLGKQLFPTETPRDGAPEREITAARFL